MNELSGSVGTARITYHFEEATSTCVTELLAYSRDEMMTMIRGIFGQDAFLFEVDEHPDSLCPPLRRYRVVVKHILGEQPSRQLQWAGN